MVRLKSGKYIDPATVFVVDILLCLQCKIGIGNDWNILVHSIIGIGEDWNILVRSIIDIGDDWNILVSQYYRYRR